MLLLKAYLILGMIYTLIYLLLRFDYFEQNSRKIADATRCPIIIVEAVHMYAMILGWGIGVLLVIADAICK